MMYIFSKIELYNPCYNIFELYNVLVQVKQVKRDK